MDSIIKKNLLLFFIVYMAVLYTAVLPAHGHEDLREHNDCALCQISNQVATAAAEVILIFLSVRLFLTRISALPHISHSLMVAYPTRAPPLS